MSTDARNLTPATVAEQSAALTGGLDFAQGGAGEGGEGGEISDLKDPSLVSWMSGHYWEGFDGGGARAGEGRLPLLPFRFQV